MTTDLEAVYAYLDLGWQVTLVPAGKKHPPIDGTTGKDHEPLSRADLATHLLEADTLQPALVMPPGVIGIDVDNYGAKHGAETFATLGLPPTWRSTSRGEGDPSGIRYYRLPDGSRGDEDEWGGGLDSIEWIRCSHRYALVAPSVHPSGDTYRWFDADDWEAKAPAVYDLPRLTTEQTAALWELQPKTTSSGSLDIFRDTDAQAFADALKAGGGHQARHDALMTYLGGAVRSGDDLSMARVLWEENMPPDRHGEFQRGVDYVKAQESEWTIGETVTVPSQDFAVWDQDPTDRLMTNIVDTDGLESLPPIEWHYHHLLPRGSFAFLYGPSGTYKSFLALSMALSLATGEDWLGHPVTTPAKSLYIAGEGFHALGQRTRAWRKHYGHEEAIEGLYWHNGPIQIASELNLTALEAYITTQGLGLVIIDTWARSSVGIDENSASDTGEAVTALDRIRLRTGCTILIVHHSGKDAAQGMRGSSALRASADVELEVTRGRLKVTKQKDGPEAEPTWFEMVPEADIFDGEGSVVAIPTGTAPDIADRSGDVPVTEDIASIIEYLEGKAEPRSKEDIFRNVEGSSARLRGSVATGIEDGYLTKTVIGQGHFIGLPKWDET